jgi:TATA-box binding protein (TBP) (component of TFIID and TFIIIB)
MLISFHAVYYRLSKVKRVAYIKLIYTAGKVVMIPIRRAGVYRSTV